MGLVLWPRCLCIWNNAHTAVGSCGVFSNVCLVRLVVIVFEFTMSSLIFCLIASLWRNIEISKYNFRFSSFPSWKYVCFISLWIDVFIESIEMTIYISGSTHFEFYFEINWATLAVFWLVPRALHMLSTYSTIELILLVPIYTCLFFTFTLLGLYIENALLFLCQQLIRQNRDYIGTVTMAPQGTHLNK